MHQKTLCHEGWISIYGFLSTAGLPILFSFYEIFGENYTTSEFWIRVIWLVNYYVIVNVLLRMIMTKENFKIAWRAALLGFVFCTGFYILFYAPNQWKAFGIYSMFLAIFHYSEYLGIAISNPSTLSVDSFILNHSLHYHVAAASSWIEFGIESYYFPGM